MTGNNFPSAKDDWSQWSKYVLEELKRLNACVSTIEKELGTLNVNLAVVENELKIKAGVWGLLAGAVPGTIALLIMYFNHN